MSAMQQDSCDIFYSNSDQQKLRCGISNPEEKGRRGKAVH